MSFSIAHSTLIKQKPKIMQVSIRVEVQKELIDVQKTGIRDVDSVYIDIYYDEEQIGHGHYNQTTNRAHIILENDNYELEDFLVNGIGDGSLGIV